MKRKSNSIQMHANDKRAHTVSRLRSAMRTIEEEIDLNNGVYPGGTLSQAEVCRRASVRTSTLQKATHKTSTLIEVNSWLETTAAVMRTSKAVRRLITGKIADLKELNRALMQQRQETELWILDTKNENAALKNRVTELESQLAAVSGRDSSRVRSIASARNGKALSNNAVSATSNADKIPN